MLNWTYIKTGTGEETLTVITSDGQATTVSNVHPNFKKLLTVFELGTLTGDHNYDEKFIKRLLVPVKVEES